MKVRLKNKEYDKKDILEEQIQNNQYLYLNKE